MAGIPERSRRWFLSRGGGLFLTSSTLGPGLVGPFLGKGRAAASAGTRAFRLGEVRPGNVFHPSQPMALRQVVTDLSGLGGTYEIDLTTKDAAGEVISHRTDTVRLAPGQTHERDVPVGGDTLGHYTATAVVRTDGGTTVATTASALARVPSPPGQLQPHSPWGIGSGGAWIGIRFDAAEAAKRLRLVAEAGIAFTREEIFWDNLEPSKGEWHWERFDPAVIAAREHQVSFLGLLDYWARWSIPDGYQERPHPTPWPQAVDNFANFCFQVVSRYKPGGVLARSQGWRDGYGIRHWEVWNEPPTFWFGTAQEFGRIVRAASAAIRRADPKAFVVVSNGGPTFDQQVIDVAGVEAYDALAIHLYPGPTGPEAGGFVEQIRESRAFLDRNDGRRVKLWVTETGWNVKGGVSAWEQASYLVRANIESVAAGVERILDFTLLYGGEGWGILDDETHPRIAYAAYATLADRLRDHRPRTAEPMGAAVRAYVFQGADRATAAVWSTAEDGRLELDAGGSVLDTYDLMGNRIGSARGATDLALTGRPAFIVARDLSAQRLGRIIRDGRVRGIAPLGIAIDNLADLPSRLPDLTVTITNRINVPQQGRATISLPEGWQVRDRSLAYGPLAPGESVVLRYALTRVAPNADNAYPVEVTATTNADPGQLTARTTLFVTAVVRGSPAINGTLDGFRAGAPVHVDRPDQVVGIPEWTPTNCSAIAWAMWDHEYFYFAASVTDDAFSQPHTGGDIWNGDSVQLMFDPQNIKQGKPPSAQEVGLALTSQGEQVYRWSGGSSSVPGARLVCGRGENGNLVYTCALPLSELRIDARVGTRIGLDFLVNDNDGGGRSGWIYWTPGIGNAWDSSKFSTWTFVDTEI